SGLSDEEVVKVWVENPYWQLFCGYDFLQWKFPLHPSSLSRWRSRLGKQGMHKILRETIRSALAGDVIRPSDMTSVIVDTTVMPKNIAFPTDSRLYYKSLLSLTRFSKRFKIKLRQSYAFLAKRSLRLVSRYAHSRKMKQARRETRRLKTYFGRVLREVERHVAHDAELQKIAASWLDDLRKIFEQQRSDSPKIYSVHEPQVECISKGKAHKKYEFGCKVSILVTHKQGIVLSSEALHGNPFDGHTLKQAIEDAQNNGGTSIHRLFVDKRYRGHGIKDKEVFISGKKKLTAHFKRLLKRRQAIEPMIGHMKSDGKLDRNYLKGREGDCFNAILCGIGHNIRLILNHLFRTAQKA
ncbi:MAG: IS5 family transposase, partial [Chlamydiales bacterium]|nr:IS5 family transposase [Chlamydiales bacterium]